MKKGQITIFIIIGLVILLAVGSYLYISGREARTELELAMPKLAELPQRAQPVRDAVHSCIAQIATDALRKMGESGGYISTAGLSFNPFVPTEGDAVQFTQDAGPVTAYWWHMKDKNSCTTNCKFDTKRPPISRSYGVFSMEEQLDRYVNERLPRCMAELAITSCSIQELGISQITSTIGETVFFTGTYPLRANCEGESIDVDDYFVNVDVPLREMYGLGTEIVNAQAQHQILEQATKNIIHTFGGIESDKLPPVRGLEVGPPKPGTYWVKFEVEKALKRLITAYTPLIQVFGVRNYNYVIAPENVRDRELFEVVYNRQFLLPLNTTHPNLEVHLSYLSQWNPYFNLNCNGQLCEADSGTNFFLIPFTINRYEFAYDLSYPVLVEIRNPFALNGNGYSLKFFLEQNMRRSDSFGSNTTLALLPESDAIPSIFCDPSQRTSGDIQMFVKDAETQRGLSDASISFSCGDNNCNLGLTTDGGFISKFPRCVGGVLRITKPDYESVTREIDTSSERGQNMTVTLEPKRAVNAIVKNLVISKEGKFGQWKHESAAGLVRPKQYQETIIMMERLGKEYDEPFQAVANVAGLGSSELILVPGKYKITLMSLYRTEVVIPPDERCFSVKKGLSSDKKCFMIPEKPIVFNATNPFPAGNVEFEYEFTSDELRGAKEIEFRTYVLGIDSLEEEDRIVEDLSELSKIELYTQANQILLWPKKT